jgi:hypothetical protein
MQQHEAMLFFLFVCLFVCFFAWSKEPCAVIAGPLAKVLLFSISDITSGNPRPRKSRKAHMIWKKKKLQWFL